MNWKKIIIRFNSFLIITNSKRTVYGNTARFNIQPAAQTTPLWNYNFGGSERVITDIASTDQEIVVGAK